MLMIRLARFGARKQPYYRVVVIEKERARNGRPVEVSKGAQLSDRVRKLLALPAPAAAASVA